MARRDRWDEETLLLLEEMRRILQYFHWKAEWWQRRANRRSDAPEAVQRGAAAYAMKQADMFIAMAKSCSQKWYPFLVYKGVSVNWLPDFIPSVYEPYRPRHTDPV